MRGNRTMTREVACETTLAQKPGFLSQKCRFTRRPPDLSVVSQYQRVHQAWQAHSTLGYVSPKQRQVQAAHELDGLRLRRIVTNKCSQTRASISRGKASSCSTHVLLTLPDYTVFRIRRLRKKAARRCSGLRCSAVSAPRSTNSSAVRWRE